MSYENEMISARLSEWVSGMEQFQLPDWEKLPPLELYMDQVIILLKQYLSPLYPSDDEKAITASIINNYVRMKVMPPPVKKKYGREHISMLFIIFLLKRVFSVSETDTLLKNLLRDDSVDTVYTEFCRHIEYAIKVVFSESEENVEKISDNKNSKYYSACALAFATKIYAEKLLNDFSKEDDEDEK